MTPQSQLTRPAPFTHADYSHLLATALDSGYSPTTFRDLDKVRKSKQRAVLLRHDCDNDLVAALKMARLEASVGVKSTFFVMTRSCMYNLLTPHALAILNRILDHGHHLGLHFDASVHAYPDSRALDDAVERECALLTSETGQTVDAVSFHQPEARILDNALRISRCNTYDRGDMAGVHYRSDSCGEWREGHPAQLFAAQESPLVQLLVHPEWWTQAPESVDDRWKRMIFHNHRLTQARLLQTERSYRTPHRLSLDP